MVVLQDIAKQEGGAAVGPAELDRVIDAARALARKQPQQADQRHHQQHPDRSVSGEIGAKEADRRERRIHRVDPERRPHDGSQRHPEADAIRKRCDGGVGGEHRSQRREVHGPVAKVGVSDPGGDEDERRTD